MTELLRQPIDLDALEAFLARNLTQIKTPILLKQFEFGQSNPTYQICASDHSKYVLRKKPPGVLVSKTAHQIEREYRIIHALNRTNVPVPKVFCLCEDDNIIGTPFYIMEFLDGRIIEDPNMPGFSQQEKKQMHEWYDAVRTLAKLHAIKPADVGLETLGKSSDFYNRQVKTFEKICQAQATVKDIKTQEKVGDIPHMQEMLQYFSHRKTQPEDRSCVIHGDYKIDNLVYHKTEPRVIGILDWEMSTIGHPLSDLTNLVTPLSVKTERRVEIVEILTSDSKKELIRLYAEVAGWDPGPYLDWGAAFGLFRLTAIFQGIASRYALGQASSAKAKEMAEARHHAAQLAWEQVLRNISKEKNCAKI